MKFLVFTDNHFREHASIINTYGDTYSTRIENQLQSLAWVAETAEEHGCDLIICAGDFFDRPELNDAEITAVRNIKWSTGNKHLMWDFVVGNHESEEIDLKYTSAMILEGEDQHSSRKVFREAKKIDYPNFELCYLPYVTERERQPLETYFGPKTSKPRIIISHNDIAGIQMGLVQSTVGFSIDEFEANADLVINGHLHNGTKVSNKVMNLGNLTGKDFGEDATKYPHRVIIVDTDTFKCEFIENPYAFNFYKLEINKLADIKIISKLKTNAVVWAKCDVDLTDQVKEAFEQNNNIIKTRLTPIRHIAAGETATVDISDLTVDHLQKLVDCVHEKLGTSPVIEELLGEICK